jgi:hypothetical protein
VVQHAATCNSFYVNAFTWFDDCKILDDISHFQ